MDKKTILSYLQGIDGQLIDGKVIPAYKDLAFVIKQLKHDALHAFSESEDKK